MKKLMIGIAVLVVIVAAFAATDSVFAQGPQPNASQSSSAWQGRGRGGGMMGLGAQYNGTAGQTGIGSGVLHDYLVSAFADKVGLTVSEVESRLDGGETLADIAVSQGVSLSDFQDWMTEIHTTAINQAVADGVISQDQADWMLSRPGMSGSGSYGTGYGMGRGMMGGGFGGYAGDCPYLDQN
jgi:hypothetical protein